MQHPHHGGRGSGGDPGTARLPEARMRACPLPRAWHGDDLGRRGGADLSADGQAALRRRAVQPARRARRSLRRDARLREGRAQARRRGVSLHARHGPEAASGWLMGRDHRQGQPRRRARRQCCRPVGARGRAHGGTRTARARDGASVPRHRRDPGDRRIAEGDAARHRLRRRDLHAPGRQGHADRHLREGRRPVGAARDAVEFHARASAARSRPHRRQPRSRLPPLSATRARGHQEDRQRSVHLRARRQSGRRADPRLAQLLGGVRRDGRIQPGRRRRPRAVELDDPRRPGLRRLGDGRRALRRLGDDGVHQREGARELFAPLSHPFPERGAARGTAFADDAHLRSAEDEGRGLRRGLRPRARAVVRAGRRRGTRGHHLPPLECARPRGRGVPRGPQRRRIARDVEFRQVRGRRGPAPARGSSRSSRTGCRAKAASRCRRC